MYTLSEKNTNFNSEESYEKRTEIPIVKLPTISDQKCFHLKAVWKENPFVLPTGIGWVDLCQDEKIKTLKDRREERRKKVHEQHTYSSRHAAQAPPTIRKYIETIDKEIDEHMKEKDKSLRKQGLDVAQKLRIPRVERESTYHLIQRKREMFLVNFTLQTKKNEITEYKLKEQAEEQKVNQLAEKLRKEAIHFDEFLKATDEAAVVAMKNAEKETRLKIEKAGELRRMQSMFNIIKAEMSKHDDLLSEYLGYKCFLLRFQYNLFKKSGLDLTSEQWQAKRDSDRKKREARKGNKLLNILDEKKRNSFMFRRHSSAGFINVKGAGRKASISRGTTSHPSRHALTKVLYPEEWEEDEKESDALMDKISPILQDVKIIMKVIHEKEEENLQLIYHFQVTQDALDELLAAHRNKMKSLDKEIGRLKGEITLMEGNISVAEQRAKEMQLMCKLLGVGTAEATGEAVVDMNRKIEKVYLNTFGRVIVNVDSLTMLTCLEKRMDSLIEQLESLPVAAVQEFQRLKDRERRLALREEKIMQHKQKQNERSKRAQERAQRSSTKKLRRKLMFRSAPQTCKQRATSKKDGDQQSDSEQFFEKE